MLKAKAREIRTITGHHWAVEVRDGRVVLFDVGWERTEFDITNANLLARAIREACLSAEGVKGE